MKRVKASVHVDYQYPQYLFVKFPNRQVAICRLSSKFQPKERQGLYHVCLVDKDGKRHSMNVARIETAIELQRDVADVHYNPRARKCKVKANAFLVALVKAKKELSVEHPNIDFDKYIDDAYLRILQSGFIPDGYQDIKNLILKNVLAVKIEREKRIVSFDNVEYYMSNEENE